MNNKEKLSIVKTKYAINGTTTYCEITFKFRPMPFIVASLRDHAATSALRSNSIPDTELIIKTLGVAKCNPNDTYDETLGKRIAFSKAFITGHKKFKFIIDMCHDALLRKSGEMGAMYTIEKEIIDRELVHLDKLTHGEY